MAIFKLISIVILIVCALLVLVVLVQNSKGGGLASNFSSSNQVMGVRKTADFLEKATWTLAGVLLLLSLLASVAIPKKVEEQNARVPEEMTEQSPIDVNSIPQTPADFQK